MDELIEIPGDEINHALNVWLHASPERNYGVMVREFHEMIGKYYFLNAFTYRLSPAAAARVRGMCGPHGHAYCKALVAVREEVT